ncbi:MAG: amidohydrolase family protein [Halioglobus sp.]|nr:amidohydrolase family protein [Halioglobus sp.]
MTDNHDLSRRRLLGVAATSAGGLALGGCGSEPESRYNAADVALLARQREEEAAASGKGPFGRQVYRGYRGLAELPWFALDGDGQLVVTDDSIPMAVDVHGHLGMSVLFRPALDLTASTPRVRHLLDCDEPGNECELDLDVYANGNFTPAGIDALQSHTVAQGLWGSEFSATQTAPNLLREMDAMRVEHVLLLPIKLGLPFGDRLTQDWRAAVSASGLGQRLHVGLSVHPEDTDAATQLREQAQAGGRIVKLHPTVQRFYPDDPRLMALYEECERLGLVVFYHGGRAGIEPDSSHPYAMPRHYEGPLRDFPQLQFILGHAGARDNAAMVDLALRYDNAWLGIHGQGVSNLATMIERTGGQRLLFGTDWPFYHLGMSLAKVLVVTEGAQRTRLRRMILRDNALALFEGRFS